MDAIWPQSQGYPTSSGSGAERFHDDDNYSWTNSCDQPDALDQEMVLMAEASAAASSDLKPGERFNHKVAPSFDGNERWYVFEELVRDWCDITSIDVKQRGPHLRNRLTGSAIAFKPQFDKAKLKEEDGVEYFLDFLRPHHLKDADAVFLFRLVQYMRIHRGKQDFGSWVQKFDVMKLRLHEAWMCTLDPLVLKDGETMEVNYNEEVRACCKRERPQIEMGSLAEESKLALVKKWREHDHKDNFPFNDHLFAMLFLLQSDLNDAQRLTLVSQFRMQKISMKNWTHSLIKDLFIELFYNPRTNFDDPNVKPHTGSHTIGSRTFLAVDGYSNGEEPALGTLDGKWKGYWVEDEETGFEGFLEEHEDEEGFNTFHIFDDSDECFKVRKVRGRKVGRRRKGKGKGKSKGSKGRGRFKRFGKSNQGKGLETGEEEPESEDAYWGKKGGKKGKGKGKFKGFGKGKSKGTGKNFGPPSFGPGFGKGGKAHEASTIHPSDSASNVDTSSRKSVANSKSTNAVSQPTTQPGTSAGAGWVWCVDWNGSWYQEWYDPNEVLWADESDWQTWQTEDWGSGWQGEDWNNNQD